MRRFSSRIPSVPFAAAIFLWALIAPFAVPQEDGATAPVNRWMNAGGSAARTGSSDGGGVTGATTTAWKLALKGEIDAEPVVWDDIVVIVEKTAPAERVAHFMRLRDGREIGKRVMQTPLPVEPTIWGDLVYCRTAPDTIRVFRVTGDAVSEKWNYQSRAKAKLGTPLVFMNEIYVREGESLIRLRSGWSSPVWRIPGSFRATLSLRGDVLYALAPTPAGKVVISAWNRADGRKLGEQMTSDYENPPGGDSDAYVTVTAQGVVIQHRCDMRALTNGLVPNVTIYRTLAQNGRMTFFDEQLFRLNGPIAAVGKRWVGSLLVPSEGPALVMVTGESFAKAEAGDKDGERPAPRRGRRPAKTPPPEKRGLSFEDADVPVIPLAVGKQNPEFATGNPALSGAGDVVFAGARAFAWRDGEVLLTDGRAAIMRSVPARESLIIVEDLKTVTVLRSARPVGAPSVAIPSGAGRTTLSGASIVLADGGIVQGDLDFDAPKGQVLVPDAQKKTKRPFGLADALLLVSTDKKTHWAQSGAAALHGYDLLVNRKEADRHLALAADAIAAGDAKAAEKLLDLARRRGAAEAAVEAAEKKLEDLIKKPIPVDSAKADLVLRGTKEMREESAEFWWGLTNGIPDGARPTLRFDLLRRVFSANPEHSAANAWVRSLVPPEAAATKAFRAVEWIDFAEAVQGTKVKIRPVLPRDKTVTNEDRDIGAIASEWDKKDGEIVGFQSDRMIVVAPLAMPGKVARAVAVGEFTCEILEKLFPAAAEARRNPRPMLVQIYRSRGEFIEKNAEKFPRDQQDAAGEFYAKIAGFYDLRSDRSRFYVSDDEQEFAESMHTMAHEITHHWISDRCPRISGKSMEESMFSPGAWIVEGFAMFIEEARLDIANRTYDLRNSASRSIDIVAHMPNDAAMPWKLLFSFKHPEVNALPPDPIAAVPASRHLGASSMLSRGNIFYSQAAAACHYLYHAENGKYRAALFDYLVDHYEAKTTDDDILRVFGLSPEDLGRRIKAWCVETIGN